MKVRKAVIPAAGLGTRFLPATKAMPKEMLPIVDTPTIQYIIDEAVKSGIEDIIVVTGRTKRAIEDHFDKAYEMETELQKSGKKDLVKVVQDISNMANIYYVRQKEAKGLGHAIHCAKTFIGDEPFAVLLGDDIVRSDKPCLAQMIEVYDKYQSTVLGVQTVSPDDISKYGAVACRPVGEPTWWKSRKRRPRHQILRFWGATSSRLRFSSALKRRAQAQAGKYSSPTRSSCSAPWRTYTRTTLSGGATTWATAWAFWRRRSSLRSRATI